MWQWLVVILFISAAVCALAWLRTYLQLTESRRERSQLGQSSRFFQEERLVLQLVANGASIKEVLDALTASIERMAPGCLCSILLLDDDGRRLRKGSGGSLPPEYFNIVDGLEIGPEVGSCGSAAFRNETIIVSDISTDPRWRPAKDLALGFGFHACWSVPIRDSQNRVLGTFAMYHKRPVSPAAHELEIVEAGAHLAGNAIERLGAERKLRETVERLRLAEEAAGFGLWERDVVTDAAVLSEGAAALTGFGQREVRTTGSAFLQVIHPDDRPDVDAARRQFTEAAQNFQIEFRVTLPDGSIGWRRCRGRAEVDEDGKAKRFIGAIIDISREKEILLSLEHSRAKAESAAQAKSEFLANMSHEIRTPMNGVIGMTGLLLDTNLTAEQRDYAEIARTSGEALLSIINDILDFSKIEAGKISIETYSFDLRLLLEEVTEMLAPQAQQKGIDLVVRYPREVPSHFIGGADRIRQVVTNLAGNAVKFTHEGHLLIEAKCMEIEGGAARMEVSVTDPGIGIPAGKLGGLFDKFSQADASTTRKFGGTGLGLAISKRLVELMGGSIRVESTVGQGSTFSFTLTMPLDAEPEFKPVSAAGSLKGLRVLIVDDNEVNRRVIHEHILTWGMRNGTYATGEQALDALQAAQAAGDPYDIVISDYQMPGIDGATLARLIKSDSHIQEPVFILLTSVSHWRDIEGADNGSVDAWLVKPVRHTKLMNTLALAWSKKHPSAFPAAKPNNAALPGTESAVSDAFEARVLVVEDNAVNQKVAVRLLAKLGIRADVAANGREGVEMWRLLPYDLVLMDCQMPEMNGYEATAQIRILEGPDGHVPIVALTADAIAGSRERCIDAGMDDIIIKPVTFENLSRMLKTWLQKLPTHLEPAVK